MKNAVLDTQHTCIPVEIKRHFRRTNSIRLKTDAVGSSKMSLYFYWNTSMLCVQDSIFHSQIYSYILKGNDKCSLRISKRNAPLIEPDEVCGCCCWLASSFEVTEFHISNIGKAFRITSLERGLNGVTAVRIIVQTVVNPICLQYLAHKAKRALNESLLFTQGRDFLHNI